jgi:Sulfotransferase family
MSLPEFFIVGAPGAGTSALHAALATHPNLYLPRIKEPRFFLSDGRPPTPERGPGDLTHASEWTWTWADYEALFAPAPRGTRLGEATPYYLSDRSSLERIRNAVPHARLVAVVRNPVDRAYSNWNRQWTDTFETRDFLDAVAAEEHRAVKGWGRVWRYLGLGRYGEQIEQLLTLFPREQLHVVRYRDLVESPAAVLDGVCRFLDVPSDVVTSIPPVQVSIFAPRARWARPAGSRTTQLLRGRVPNRLGADAVASGLPGIDAPQRPELTPDERRALIGYFADDIRHLEELLGRSFWDWFSEEGLGSYTRRRTLLTRRPR